MKKLILFSLILTFSLLAYSQNSHIQVIAEPGIKIFLNGEFKDITSSDLGGLIISNLLPGTYKIKAIKENFQPQEETITLKAGEVKEYKVKPFTPRISISESGTSETQTLELKTGELKIQSLPIAIDISIPSLGIDRKKTQDEWLAKEIPVGLYKAKFEWNGKTLIEEIEIVENELTHIFVDMLNEKVEYRKRAGSVGSLKISSTPNGKLVIDGNYVGITPYFNENIRIGDYTASVSINFNKSEYLDNEFTLSKEYSITKNRLTELNFDFYSKYHFGNLNVNSTKPSTVFSLVNKTTNRTYNSLHSNFSKSLLVGYYDLRLSENNNIYSFSVFEDKVTTVKINPKIQTLPYLSLNDIYDYQSFENYFKNNYSQLNEYKYDNQLQYNWIDGSTIDWMFYGSPTIWGATWGVISKIVGGLGWGMLFADMSMDTPEFNDYYQPNYGMDLAVIGIGALIRHLIAPLSFDKVKTRHDINIRKNKEASDFYYKNYNIKLNNEWQPELENKNSEIKKKNSEIKRKNSEIKEVEIIYE